ncbi:MAG: carbon starvation protein A [Pseudoflavonifractor sp.]|nr:carbon starvation protein A [Alloprevotella sp.]MCM1116614.1 carbon starvation protein A [Pseudoflavonifractor sp.]
MTLFLIALALLIGGYFTYGLIIDRVLATDPKRPMPCNTHRDGVDFIPIPAWKAFLIQFLNIAGLGPIFGAIMGVMFGPAAFLWITFGTIFAGAVHDFVSGVVSIRSGGASLPEIVGENLGLNVKRAMTLFSCVLLILVGAVFISTPASIIAELTPAALDKWFWVVAIFIYYLLATLLPIDKLIGNLYPIFGLALLFMAAGIMGVMLLDPSVQIPVDIQAGLGSRSSSPVFPMMFVSIACGAISGFHATQSPMMARCLTNERLARPIFYGAMVAEGIVALIWAAAAIAFTGGYDQLAGYFASHAGGAATLVNDISLTWLGALGGVLAILGVVAAPITSGDTALRSTRLIIADFLHLDQSSFLKRVMVSLPIFAIVAMLMFIDFNILWRYFAWSNQTLSEFTLWAVTVYLARHRRLYIVTLIPAVFMTIVCTSYLLYAPSPEGLGLDMPVAVGIGILVAMIFSGLFMARKKSLPQPIAPENA